MRCGFGRKRPPRRLSPSTALLRSTSTPSVYALDAAEARGAKAAARLAKAREDRAEAAGAVAEAEEALRAKVAPVLSLGGILPVWAAEVLALRPALCV
jgi:hypothetical protein